jgi:competence protein ComEA
MADRRKPALAILLSLMVLAAGLRAASPSGRVAGDPIGDCPVFAGIYGDIPEQGVYCVHPQIAVQNLLGKARVPGCVLSVPQVEPGSRLDISVSDGRCGIRLGRLTGAQILSLGMKLDINRATSEDLEALPGVGPLLAERISGYRISHGPFKNVESLAEVRGVGPAILARIAGLVEAPAISGR